MGYKIWNSGVIRDATPEEIEQMKNLPKPYEETNIPVPTPEDMELQDPSGAPDTIGPS